MNEDDLVMQYIRVMENPDSIGLQNGIWTSPTLRGYDKNQIGYGLDKNTNKELREFLEKNKRDYLTEEEEINLRHNYVNGYLTDIWDRNTKGRQFSEKKKAIAYGLLYHGYGKNLWNRRSNGIYDAFWNGTDDEFQNVVHSFYNGLHTERARNHLNFWNNASKIKPKPYQFNYTSIPSWQPPISYKKQGGKFYKPKFRWYKQNS